MRIVMMGTGPFAVPTFEQLLDSNHEILCLVTRPDAKSSGRRNKITNPMREIAQAKDLDIFDPPSVNADGFVEQLERMNADLFVVCDYGQILSKKCLAAARLGGINLHGSLLPKYRGAAPINWAIYNGEIETGITVIHMTPRLDGGPMLAQVVVPIEPHETAVELEPRMSLAGVFAVMESIDSLAEWNGQDSIGEIQDNGNATKAPRLNKTDGLIDWNRTAEQIRNQIRAFKPWPGTYTHWLRDEGEPLRLIVHQATVVEKTTQQPPGRVELISEGQLLISTAKNCLQIESVQPAGKRQMDVAEFLRGNPIKQNDSFK